MKTMWSGIVLASAVLGLFACDVDTAPSAEELATADQSAQQASDGATESAQSEDVELAQKIAAAKLAANPGAVASPENAACGKVGTKLDGKRVNDAASPNTALQRSGSSTSCTATGQLNPGDDAIYFCYTNANDGFTWTYLERVGGNRGWVRDTLLRDGGSFVHCSF